MPIRVGTVTHLGGIFLCFLLIAEVPAAGTTGGVGTTASLPGTSGTGSTGTTGSTGSTGSTGTTGTSGTTGTTGTTGTPGTTGSVDPPAPPMNFSCPLIPLAEPPKSNTSNWWDQGFGSVPFPSATASFTGLLTTLVTSFSVLMLCLVLFAVVRRGWLSFCAPKTFLENGWAPSWAAEQVWHRVMRVKKAREWGKIRPPPAGSDVSEQPVFRKKGGGGGGSEHGSFRSSVSSHESVLRSSREVLPVQETDGLLRAGEPNVFRKLTNWILFTFSFPEDDILRSPGGFDAVFYLRFLKYSAYLFTVMALLGCMFLIPVNLGGPRKDMLRNSSDCGVPLDSGSNSSNCVAGLDVISLSNIGYGSGDMWWHVGSMYIFTALCSFFLFWLYRDYIALLKVQSQKTSVQSRTVMVTGLDRTRIKSNNDLFQYFERLYGEGSVLCAQVTPLVERGSTLWKLQADAEYQQKHLRRAYGVMFRNWEDNQVEDMDVNADVRAPSVIRRGTDDQRPRVKLGALGVVGEEVDALDHFEREYSMTQRQITELITEMGHYRDITNWGFVTFERITTAMICVQSLHNESPAVQRCVRAPMPRDIFWDWSTDDNQGWKRTLRLVVSSLLLIALFLLWTIPVGLWAELSRMDNLRKNPKFDFLVDFLDKNPVLEGYVQGTLPSAGLLATLAIAPYLMRLILVIRKFRTNTTRHRNLMRLYWAFLTFFLLLGSAIQFTIGNLIAKLIEQPTLLVAALAQSLPATAAYFCNYIIFSAWVIWPVFYLLRLDEMAICKIKQSLLCHTRQERLEAEMYSFPYDFPLQWTRDLVILGLGLTFSTLAPIVLPLTWAYFVTAWFIAKYNFVYVQLPDHQGFKMIASASTRITISLLIYQISMFGLLRLKEFQYSAVVLILPVLTTGFRIYLKVRFQKASSVISLEQCLELDNRKGSRSGADGEGADLQDFEEAKEDAREKALKMFVHPFTVVPPTVDAVRKEELANAGLLSEAEGELPRRGTSAFREDYSNESDGDLSEQEGSYRDLRRNAMAYAGRIHIKTKLSSPDMSGSTERVSELVQLEDDDNDVLISPNFNS